MRRRLYFSMILDLVIDQIRSNFFLIDEMFEFLMFIFNFFDSKDSRFFAIETNKIDEDFESEFELII